MGLYRGSVAQGFRPKQDLLSHGLQVLQGLASHTIDVREVTAIKPAHAFIRSRGRPIRVTLREEDLTARPDYVLYEPEDLPKAW